MSSTQTADAVLRERAINDLKARMRLLEGDNSLMQYRINELARIANTVDDAKVTAASALSLAKNAAGIATDARERANNVVDDNGRLWSEIDKIRGSLEKAISRDAVTHNTMRDEISKEMDALRTACCAVADDIAGLHKTVNAQMDATTRVLCAAVRANMPSDGWRVVAEESISDEISEDAIEDVEVEIDEDSDTGAPCRCDLFNELDEAFEIAQRDADAGLMLSITMAKARLAGFEDY